jgi:hypothetical protein
MLKQSTCRWIGVGVLALGAGVTAFCWVPALVTKGLLPDDDDSKKMYVQMHVLGALLAATGVSILVLPRAWFGQDGKFRFPGWWPFLATVGLGLLLVAGDMLVLGYFQRQWEAARRTHRACGEELVWLSAGYTEVLVGIRDQASARKAEEKLRGYAQWARELRERTKSLGTPTREDTEWLGEEVFPALAKSSRKRAETPRRFTTPEVDRLRSEIGDDIIESMYFLAQEQFEEELRRLKKGKPKP